MKKLILFLLLAILINCEKPKNTREIAENFMMQVLGNNLKSPKNIDIESFDPDSFYMPIFEDPVFIEKYSRLTENYNTLVSNIREYTILKGRGYKTYSKTYANGEFIDLYQDSVKAMITELNDFINSYEPPYMGVRVPMYIEFNNDSIIFAEVILNDELDSMIQSKGIFPRHKDAVIKEYGKINKKVINNAMDKMNDYQNKYPLNFDTNKFIPKMYIEK